MIFCDDVYKSFGEVHAVDGVRFSIDDGTFLGLLGPNGAGKTTLIRLMIGLLDLDSGCIKYDDTRMTKNAIDLKKKIGVVSQHVNLDKELTVKENMEFIGRLYHMPKKMIEKRTDELLDVFDLAGACDRIAKKLSGGMARKLMIARAMIHDPQYLFLDEPTVGIDATMRKEIWSILRTQHRLGKTIVLTSHYIEEIEQLCDRVMLIDEGKIFKDGSARSLIDEAGALTLEDVFFLHTNKKVAAWK